MTTATISLKGGPEVPLDHEDVKQVLRTAIDNGFSKSPRRRTGGIAGDQLKSIIERLEEEKAGLASDIRDVYAEAKGNGFDVPTIRQIVKLRKMEASDREEQESLLDLYKRAIGMEQPDLFTNQPQPPSDA